MGMRLILVKDVAVTFRWRIPLLLGLMIISGVFEGLAVTAVLPLLAGVGKTDGQVAGPMDGVISFLALAPKKIGLPEGAPGIGLLMVILVVLSAASFLLMARLATSLQASYVYSWQTSVFSAVLAAKPAFLASRRGGDILAAIVSEVNRLGGAFYLGCLVLVSCVNLVIYAGLALAVSLKISISLMLLGGVLFLATRPFLRRAYGYGEAITRSQADIQTLAGEGIHMFKALKANVAERNASEKFSQAARELAAASFHNSFDVQKAKAVFEFGSAAGLAALLVAGPLLFEVQLANVLVVLALFIRLFPRITALQQGLQALNVLLPAVGNLHKLRQEAQSAAEPEDPRPLPELIARSAPTIAFRRVTIQRGAKEVLRGLNVEFPAGEVVAIVGPSGSGKSTLVDAILGLVPLHSGHVEVSEMDLKNLPMPAWRRSIGYVAQDTALLGGTIAENISLGSQACASAVDLALRKVAGSFVDGLPARASTKVGDRGTRLSGGERQRVGLARALAVPRLLYIFDEATSALDSETEAEVLQSLKALAGRATILLVAHRFSAVRIADRIHVLEKGQITETGDWVSLDRPGTRFYALKQLQEMTTRVTAS